MPVLNLVNVKGESNEQVLLKGLVSNDKKAIETIYKQNFNSVQGFIVNNNGSYDDARDVFQEAIMALYHNAQSPSFVLNCQIKTYLYSVSRRIWLKKLQQSNRFSAQVEGMENVVMVEEDIAFHEKQNADFEIMERALNSLGEPCKGVLEAYYLQRKDMRQIAEEFGYTNADNAKTQKYKCLGRLKKLFFAQYNIGE